MSLMNKKSINRKNKRPERFKLKNIVLVLCVCLSGQRDQRLGENRNEVLDREIMSFFSGERIFYLNNMSEEIFENNEKRNLIN